ncbi:hypothetical protein ACHAPV_004561 [Trichoderma viride]
MAAVGNVARQLRDRMLRERSIRVLVSPTPITFAERRSILQVLEQYGPVEFFKMLPNPIANLKSHYSQYVSITKEPTTAERLVASSPLTYKITEPTRKAVEDIYVADLDESEGFSTLQPTVTGEQTDSVSSRSDGPTEDPKQGQKEFKIHIYPAPDYNHRFAMAGSPLHIPWPDAYEQEQSFIATTLKQSLPNSIASIGLTHWLVSDGSGALRMERKVKRKRIREWLPSKMKKGTTG